MFIQKHLEVYGNTTKRSQIITTNSESFKSKAKVAAETSNNGNTKKIEIVVL